VTVNPTEPEPDPDVDPEPAPDPEPDPDDDRVVTEYQRDPHGLAVLYGEEWRED